MASRPSSFSALLAAAVAAGCLTATAVQAQQPDAKPLYEVEVFGAGSYNPDYPGASQSHLHGIGFPWLSYRGEYLRTDEKGSIAGRLVHSRRFELDVSASGSFPASSKDNTARSGMPDLDWMGEIGPRARANLYYWQNGATGDVSRLSLELPVRAVFSTNFNSRFDYRGVTASPAVAFSTNHLMGTRTGLKLSAGPIFATEELMDYFYQVDRQYATAGRQAYDAKAGYMGSKAKMGISAPVNDRVKLFGSTSVDYLGGSANADSPLLREKVNFSGMVGMSISLYRSDAREKAPE